jgi:hypothetical protein
MNKNVDTSTDAAKKWCARIRRVMPTGDPWLPKPPLEQFVEALAAERDALRKERDEAREQRDLWRGSELGRQLDQARDLLWRRDIAAILRGEAVAVPVEPTRQMEAAAIAATPEPDLLLMAEAARMGDLTAKIKAEMLRLEAAAFERGAKAMREAIADYADCKCKAREEMLRYLATPGPHTSERWRICGQANCAAEEAHIIRARPIPEDKR